METAQIEQLAFEFAPIVQPEDSGETIRERFEAFHAANPHVFRLLRELALEYKRAGRKHGGMKMFYEVLRFRSGIYTQGDPYKLNNDFTALYARKLMTEEPELAGFFEIRERRAE
jgi:hypothetical protein